MKPARNAKPRLAGWERAGRTLRDLDPDRFAVLLALAQAYAAAFAGDDEAFQASMARARPPASADELAAQRRRSFKVIDGGLGRPSAPSGPGGDAA